MSRIEREKPRYRIKGDQRGGAIPIGLIASAATPFLREIVKPIFKTIFGRGRRIRRP